MKAFRFDLESLLELRGRAREEAARALAAARRRRVQADGEQQRQRARAERVRETIGQRRRAGVAAWEEKGLRDALLHEEEALERLRKAWKATCEEEKAARDALLKARTDAKAIEQLKSRRKREFLREWERKEEKRIQEVADAAFSRRSRAGPSHGIFENVLEVL